MSKSFLFYSVRDGFDLAKPIETGLAARGHHINSSDELKVASNWRNTLIQRLDHVPRAGSGPHPP
jgi:hypothetical protein